MCIKDFFNVSLDKYFVNITVCKLL